MTQTPDRKLEVDQVVSLTGTPGFFRIIELPEHGKHVTLYGGLLQRRGGIRCSTRTVVPAKVEVITSAATMKRAKATLHAIAEVMETAPRARAGRAGGK